MNEDVKNLLAGLGAFAEALGVLRDESIRNGFTREEAFRLCVTYFSTLLQNGKKQDGEA